MAHIRRATILDEVVLPLPQCTDRFLRIAEERSETDKFAVEIFLLFASFDADVEFWYAERERWLKYRNLTPSSGTSPDSGLPRFFKSNDAVLSLAESSCLL